MMKTLPGQLMAAFAALMFSTTVNAAPLLPGSVIFPTGDTVATAPATAGVVQNDNLISFSFDITPFTHVGGNVQNRVVESGLLNTTIFSPRIRDTYNIATLGFEIIGFSLDGYAGWDTDIGYRTDGLGDKGPTSVSRSADGDRLTFRYGNPLFVSGLLGGPREESLFPYIVTNAANYAFTGSMRLFGVDVAHPERLFSVELTGLAVPATVPEPTIAWLFGTGLLGLMGITKRRNWFPGPPK